LPLLLLIRFDFVDFDELEIVSQLERTEPDLARLLHFFEVRTPVPLVELVPSLLLVLGVLEKKEPRRFTSWDISRILLDWFFTLCKEWAPMLKRSGTMSDMKLLLSARVFPPGIEDRHPCEKTSESMILSKRWSSKTAKAELVSSCAFS